MNNLNPLYLRESNSAQVLKAGQSVVNKKIAQGMNPEAARNEVASRMDRIANRKYNNVRKTGWNDQRWGNADAMSNGARFLRQGNNVQDIRRANNIPTPPSERM